MKIREPAQQPDIKQQPDIERPIDLNDNPVQKHPKPDEQQPETPTPPEPTD
ncbi:hypothetical protein [Actinoplanes couchii]|uniref:Uncharacterized protein n=1 Tax=Actinoplanes couchii TaxID=403638 RepID=A0ABQ3XDU6_9ACTN|nr:hypothetical protein [Actinoplanes couchii]MDR6317184.1 hypothetical protein [Actinoplanes couchii]GID56679.1 hypothetical protein Aco03nite_050830 [Actinoplanes couchii]